MNGLRLISNAAIDNSIELLSAMASSSRSILEGESNEATKLIALNCTIVLMASAYAYQVT